MAKQGMDRPDRTHPKPRNREAAVPEMQGKAKHGTAKARPIIAGTAAPAQKVYHAKPHTEQPAPSAGFDTDLAADNLENDLTAADRQDLR